MWTPKTSFKKNLLNNTENKLVIAKSAGAVEWKKWVKRVERLKIYINMYML